MFSLRLDTLLKSGTGGDHIDLDAGLLAEGVEQRLYKFAFTIRVNVDLARLGESGARRHDRKYGKGETRARTDQIEHGQRSRKNRCAGFEAPRGTGWAVPTSSVNRFPLIHQ